jgi:hypothetical protein
MLNRKINSEVWNKKGPKQCQPSDQSKGISWVFKDYLKKLIQHFKKYIKRIILVGSGDTHQDVKNIQVYMKIKILLSIKVAY